ncbi:cell wall surface anchor family protein [Planoprotostelium fungivorum]|uniref:Cell wall surface anchor family protein n=1 Tax=Planoprotostelium fungivorum TaxID=1890364 RepID=A0A2P6NJW2_9EUKA|nr:cell wall surface anchor family protein [Planoprotostelium fungivorum]
MTVLAGSEGPWSVQERSPRAQIGLGLYRKINPKTTRSWRYNERRGNHCLKRMEFDDVSSNQQFLNMYMRQFQNDGRGQNESGLHPGFATPVNVRPTNPNYFRPPHFPAPATSFVLSSPQPVHNEMPMHNQFRRQMEQLDGSLFDVHQDNQIQHHPHWSSDDSSGVLSSSSSPASDFNNPTLPQTINNDSQLEVVLLHKPRGSQGIWQPVPPGAGLRVTKGKGKRLKLQIKSTQHIEKNNLEITMMDLMTSVASNEGFEVEHSFEVISPLLTELELKLSRYYKRGQFIVTAKTPMGLLTAKSIEFCSHNNGKQTKSDALPTPSIPSFSSTVEKQSQPIPTAPSTEPSQRRDSFTGEKKRKNPPLDEEGNRVNVVEGNLEVEGTVRARAFMQFSDIRLKTNIEDLADALAIVTNLQGKTYQWKRDCVEGSHAQRVIGLIAQEVQRVLPEVVYVDPVSGILSVSYAEIIPVIIEAFKQHHMDTLNDRKEVTYKLEQMRSQLDSIERETRIQQSRMYQHLRGSRTPHQQFAYRLTNIMRLLLMVFGIVAIVAAFILLARFKRRPPLGSILILFIMGFGFVVITTCSLLMDKLRVAQSLVKEEEMTYLYKPERTSSKTMV